MVADSWRARLEQGAGSPLTMGSGIIWPSMLPLRFLLLSTLVLLVACGSDEQTAPVASPSPSPSPRTQTAAQFFPVTVVVETGKSHLTVGSVTKEESPMGSSWARLVIAGSVKALSPGRFDYGLTVTDAEGVVYKEDSPGILLGDRAQGEEPAYTTFITVPADATLTRVSYWVAGADRPELSYHIDLPVEDIAPRRP